MKGEFDRSLIKQLKLRQKYQRMKLIKVIVNPKVKMNSLFPHNYVIGVYKPLLEFRWYTATSNTNVRNGASSSNITNNRKKTQMPPYLCGAVQVSACHNDQFNCNL